MKKIINFLLIGFFICSVQALWAQVEISLPRISAEKGETVIVPVTIGDISEYNVIAYELDVNYSPEVVDFISASYAGTMSEAWGSPTFNKLSTGKAMLSCYGTTPLEGEGTIINLYFKVVGDPGTGTNLFLVKLMLNDKRPETTANHGSIDSKKVPVSVTITTSTGDGQVIVDGTTYDAPCQTTLYKYIPSTIGVPESFDMGGGTRYSFSAWSDDGAREHEVVLTGDSTFTAQMDLSYLLDIISEYGTPLGAGWHLAGSTVQISVDNAVPVLEGVQKVFVSWSGYGPASYSGKDNPATIIMDSPMEETVIWQKQCYLTVQADFGNPQGEGWYNAGDDASFSVDASEEIENQERHLFTSWTGSGDGAYTGTDLETTVVMDNPITEVANSQTQYFLATSINDENRGSVFPAPPGGWYEENERAEVVATANEGFGLLKWEGDLSSSEQNESVRMSRAKSVTANFENYIEVEVAAGLDDAIVFVDGVEYIEAHDFNWLIGSTHQLDVPMYQFESSLKKEVFAYWMDSIDSGEKQRLITITGDSKWYRAHYITQYPVYINCEPSNGGTTSPATSPTWYDKGETIKTTAIAGDGFVFNEWKKIWEYGTIKSSLPEMESVIMSALTFTAYFNELLQIGTLSLPNGTVNNYYSFFVETDGGLPPLNWAIQSGTLPSGLTLDTNTGQISGTPTEFGDFEFTVLVSDSKSTPQQATQTYQISIKEYIALFSDDFSDGNIDGWEAIDEGARYRPSNWSVNGGELTQTKEVWGGEYDGASPDKPGTNLVYPADWDNYEFECRMMSDDDHAIGAIFRYQDTNNYYLLSMDSKDGYRRVVKKENGSYSTITDENFSYYMGNWYTVRILCKDDEFQIYFDDALKFSFTDDSHATGGIGFYCWKNADSHFDDVIIKEIQTAPVSISTSSLANGTVGSVYSQTLTAAGGKDPYSWAIDGGSLPTGLSLNSSTGTISGTPTTDGSFDFTVQVLDSDSPQSEFTRNLTIVIDPPLPVEITTTGFSSGMISEFFSETLEASGGLVPYLWQIITGALPAGLSLNSNTGQISGTPNSVGNFDFGVEVSDANSPADTDQKDFSITIANVPPVQITTTSLPDANINTAYSASLAVEDGTVPYFWSIASGSLPPGISLNSGVISGTPTASGIYRFEVEVLDSSTPQTSAAQEFTLQVTETMTLLTDDFNDGNYSGWTIVEEGGNRAPAEWAVSSGVLQQTSNIYGDPRDPSDPDKPGTFMLYPGDWENYEFTVKVRSDDDDAIGIMFRYQDQSNYYRVAMNSQAGFRRLVKKVNGINHTLAEDDFIYTEGVWYTFRVLVDGARIQVWVTDEHNKTLEIFDLEDDAVASGGVALYCWNNDRSYFDDVEVIGTVSGPDPLNITTSTLDAGEVSVNYSATLAVTGGTGPFTWEITNGTLPSGLSLYSNGTLSGTPIQSGTFVFTTKVTDSGSPAQYDSQEFSLVIEDAPPLTIATTSLADGMVNESYSGAMEANGGLTPYAWSIQSGSLPAGLSLNSQTGKISGTPTTAGVEAVTLQVVDSSSPAQQVSKALQITISSVPPVQITTTSLPDGAITLAYSASLQATSGTAPYTWQVASGSLPPGISLNSGTGVLSGTPAIGGDYSFELEVVDSSEPQTTDTQDFTISVDASLTLLTDDFNDGNYSGWQIVEEGGNRGPSEWAVSSGVMQQTSNIYGDPRDLNNPDKPGTFALYAGDWENYEFTAKVQSADDDGIGLMFRYKDQANYYRVAMNRQGDYLRLMKKVAGANYTIEDQSFTYNEGVWYTFRIVVEDAQIQVYLTDEHGTESKMFDVEDSSVPSGGVALYCWNNDRSYFDDVEVVGSASGPDPLNITTTSLNSGITGESYSTTITATGGTSPFTWQVSSGNLPSGLSLNTTGVLSGTPTQTGTFNFTAKISDSGIPVQNDTQNLTLVIETPPPLTISTSSLPDGMVNTSYSTTLEAEGGTSPYEWAISNGSLPAGLSLNSQTGKISGTPTIAGAVTLTVQAIDNSSPQEDATRQLTLTISSVPPVQITTTSLPDGAITSSYSATVQATSGTTPYNWQVASGNLPPGVSLNSSTGVLSGTPAAGGTYTFQLEVVDSSNPQTSDVQSYTISVDASLTLLTDNFDDGNYTGWQIVEEGGNRGPSEWAVSSGVMQQTSNIYGEPRDLNNPDKPGTFALYAGDWENYEFTAKVQSADDDGIGLMFRYKDQANYYRVAMNRQGDYLRLMKKVAGANSTIADQSFTYNEGVWYTFRIVVEDAQIQVYMTDEHGTESKMFDVEDSSVPSGGVALYCWNNDRSYFDDVEVIGYSSEPDPLVFTVSSLSGGTAGMNYESALTLTGGTTPYKWSIIDGALPGNLSLNGNTGAVSGIPYSSGTYSFKVKATDSGSPTLETSQNFSLVIGNPQALEITTAALSEAVVDNAYEFQLAASGGIQPYEWAKVEGSLPAGITLTESGLLSGTATTSAVSTFTVRVMDNSSPALEEEKQFTLNVNTIPPVNITTTALPNGTIETAYSATLEAEEGKAPYAWSVASGNLPPGLALNASTGKISGTPSAGGNYAFEIKVTDSAAEQTSDTQAFAVSIIEELTLIDDNFDDGNFSGWTVVDDGGNRGPSDWQVQDGVVRQLSNIYGDPRDLTSPDKPGTYLYQFGDWKNYEFTVNLRSDDDDGIGVMFRYQNQGNYYRVAMNQQGDYIRLVKNANGYNQTLADKSFTYAKAEWYRLRIRVDDSHIEVWLTDELGDEDKFFDLEDSSIPTGGVALYSWNNDECYFDDVLVIGASSGPDPLNITTTGFENGVVGTAYAITLAVTGGTAPVTWSVTDGALPDGLQLNETSGAISGTPTKAGSYEFTIRVKDSGAQQDIQTYSMTIENPPALTVASGTLEIGTIGTAYSVDLEATGGIAPYSWSIQTGSLPAGLVLNSEGGRVSGVPTAVGSGTFTVKVVDNGNPAQEATKELSIQINSIPPVEITTTGLISGALNASYSVTLEATSGTEPYTWTVAKGSLPPGLSLKSATGVISGTAGAGGNYDFSVKVTDSSNPQTSDSVAFSIEIIEQVILFDDSFSDNDFDGWDIKDDGGYRGPSEWKVVNGVVQQNSNIYGDPKDYSDPDKPGTYLYKTADWENYELTAHLCSNDDDAIGVMFRFQDNNNYYRLAMNSEGQYRRLMKKVNGTNYTIAEDAFVYAKANWYTVKIVLQDERIRVFFTNEEKVEEEVFDVQDASFASGGIALYCWYNDESFFDDVLVTNVMTGPEALEFKTPSFPLGKINNSYSSTLSASGGTTPYSWEITDGELPTGLSLNASSGNIAGTATAEGKFTFTAKVSDSGSPEQTVSKELYIIIQGVPKLTITTTSLKTNMVYEDYSDTLETINGESPFEWSIDSGNLPAGLSLNSTKGVISGKPTVSGTFKFTIKVVDSATPQQEDTEEISLTIEPRPDLEITTTELKNGAIETPYSDELQATGGLEDYTWSIIDGDLPDGLSLDAEDGKISGTPGASGSFNFCVRAIDSAVPADTSDKDLSITISNSVTYLEESFEDGDFDGWTIVDEGTSRGPSVWSIYWNSLEQTSDIYDSDRNAAHADQLGTYVYWQDLSWSDVEINLEVRSDDDDAIGVMFRYQDADNYYRFSMDQERQYRRLVRRLNGVSTILAEDSEEYVYHQWLPLKIIAMGTSIMVYYENEKIFDVQDAELSTGGMALYSWYNNSSKFDNIVVATPSLARRRARERELANMEIPASFSLYQNFPNPFNPETQIKFDLPENGEVSLKIYNLLGEEVRTLATGQIEAGRHQFRWNGINEFGESVASGIYIYRIVFRPNEGTGKIHCETRKMIFMK